MMPQPFAADEVSELALRNDVVRCAHNDATFAFHVPQAHIMRNALRCAHHCRRLHHLPAGQTSCKKALAKASAFLWLPELDSNQQHPD